MDSVKVWHVQVHHHDVNLGASRDVHRHDPRRSLAEQLKVASLPRGAVRYDEAGASVVLFVNQESEKLLRW